MQGTPCLFLLLLTVVPVMAQANFQCSENETQNSELSHPCNQIYAELESALVSTDNLYVLRITFYPSTRFAPALLEVNYNIQLPGNRTFTTTLGWTDSSVFAAINPRTLLNLQLRILYWPLRNLLLEPGTIDLTLNTQNNDSEVLSEANTTDITEVLKILNARLLVYATMQDVLIDWDGTDRGYTWDVQGGNDVLFTVIVIVTTPIALILIVVLADTLENVLDRKSLFKHLHLGVLYAGFEIPAFAVIIFESWSSYVLVAECKHFSCILKASTVVPVVIFTCGCLFKCTCECYKEDCTPIRHIIFYLPIRLFSELLFLKALVALTSISLIPFILLVVVYPAEILCTVIIYFSILIMSAGILSPLILVIGKCGTSEPGKLCEDPESIFLAAVWTHLALSFVSLAAMLLCLLYMQALLAGATSNVVVTIVLFGSIIGLIPSSIYGADKAANKLQPTSPAPSTTAEPTPTTTDGVI